MRGVLFDLGGVVLESPLPAIARVEEDHGISRGELAPLLVAEASAFSSLMRGEIGVDDFDHLLAAETSGLGTLPVGGRALLTVLEDSVTVRPAYLAAADAIRTAGLATGVVTNNWPKMGVRDAALAGHFDVFVESWVVGVAKPAPRIYLEACTRLGLAPGDVVFLDDFGENLATARRLGMRTILVTDPGRALTELGGLLGLHLLPDGIAGARAGSGRVDGTPRRDT